MSKKKIVIGIAAGVAVVGGIVAVIVSHKRKKDNASFEFSNDCEDDYGDEFWDDVEDDLSCEDCKKVCDSEERCCDYAERILRELEEESKRGK